MEMNEITANEEVVENEVEVDAYESDRDWKETAAAIGVGALAIDGAIHVGRFVYLKAVKPLCGKVKEAFQKAKTAKSEEKTAASAEAQKTEVTK